MWSGRLGPQSSQEGAAENSRAGLEHRPAGLPAGSGASCAEAQFSVTSVLHSIHVEAAAHSVGAAGEGLEAALGLLSPPGTEQWWARMAILAWHWELEWAFPRMVQLPRGPWPRQKWALWGAGKGICLPRVRALSGPLKLPCHCGGRWEVAQLGLPWGALAVLQKPQAGQQAAVFTEAHCQSCFCFSCAWPW